MPVRQCWEISLDDPTAAFGYLTPRQSPDKSGRSPLRGTYLALLTWKCCHHCCENSLIGSSGQLIRMISIEIANNRNMLRGGVRRTKAEWLGLSCLTSRGKKRAHAKSDIKTLYDAFGIRLTKILIRPWRVANKQPTVPTPIAKLRVRWHGPQKCKCHNNKSIPHALVLLTIWKYFTNNIFEMPLRYLAFR